MHFLSLVGCKISPTDYSEYPITGRRGPDAGCQQTAGQGVFYPAVLLVVVQPAGLGRRPGSRRNTPGSWSSASGWWAGRTSSSPPAPPKTLPVRPARWTGFTRTSPSGCTAAMRLRPANGSSPNPVRCWWTTTRRTAACFRRYGGRALLVPRPWNRLHRCSTSMYLVEGFGRLLARQGEFRVADKNPAKP